MPRIQRIVFVIGLLAATALASTVAGILLHRAFPGQPWVTIIGPLCAMAVVLGLAKTLFRK